MRRMLILLAAGLIAVVAIVLLAARSGADHDVVSVYPNHRTLDASPRTAIILRGADPDDLGEVTVSGSRSGRHGGRLRSQADGRGAAFVPDRPFAPGERVTVDAGMRVAGMSGKESSFVIARSAEIGHAPFDDAEPEGRAVRHFRSRPDLRPPVVSVEKRSESVAPGSVFVAPKRGESQQGPMILDDRGGLVWFHPLPGDEQAFDFRAQTYDGKPVLTWWQGRMMLYKGNGSGRILDSSYRPVATVRAGNGYQMDAHEFQLTPSGTALVISYVTVPWDLSKLGGRRDGVLDDCVVQEIDVKSGAVLFEWHALGTIPLGESYRPAPAKRGMVHDPFHINSAALDSDGNLVVSARHTSTVYKIDRRSGDIMWRLGGKKSDFAMGPGTTFRLQHDARPAPDGTISVFDNVAEDLPAHGRSSRGLVLALDERKHTASLVHEYKRGLLSPTQGSMQQLDGGAAFVGWGGSQPFFTQFDRDGRVVFDARFHGKRVESYRAYWMQWSAEAPGRPSVTATAVGRGTTVRVSWNGATNVAAWRVRAGGAATQSPRRGFETTIQLAGRPGSVAVDALDDSGKVLGSSVPTPVR